MKLKTFRGLLFASFFIIEALSLFFFVKSIINLIGLEKELFMDGIMYTISLLILIAFVGMEIFNTYYSIQNGSSFIEPLLYSQDTLNKKCLYGMRGGSVVAFIGFIYSILLLFANIEFALSNLNVLVKSIMLCFSLMVFVNTLFVSIYPFVKDKK